MTGRPWHPEPSRTAASRSRSSLDLNPAAKLSAFNVASVSHIAARPRSSPDIVAPASDARKKTTDVARAARTRLTKTPVKGPFWIPTNVSVLQRMCRGCAMVGQGSSARPSTYGLLPGDRRWFQPPADSPPAAGLDLRALAARYAHGRPRQIVGALMTEA